MNIIPWRRRESMVPTGFDLDDLWSRFWGNGNGDFATHLPETFRNRPFPAVNVAESEDSYSITVDCPGMEEDDLHVETMGNQLHVSGERKWEEEKKDKEYRRVESQYGRFERVIPLPENVSTDSDAIEARYKKGILTITVPKLQRTPSAKIKVKAE